jgi:DNA-binding transcriptional regulator YiaG
MEDTRTCAEIILEKRRALPAEPPTIKDIVIASKMTQRSFAEHLNIPLRTVENWCGNTRKCPDYVLELIIYKLKSEGIIKETEE